MDYNGTQVDLLIAILVRFPYIGTIHCEPETETLRFVFLLHDAEQDFKEFAWRFQAHLGLFHELMRKPMKEFSLNEKKSGQVTVIEVVRDVASLSLAELKLIVQLVQDYYGANLVQEGPDVKEEDAEEQEWIIEALLRERAEFGRERLTGFREDGKVLVFSTAVGVDRQ